MGRVAQIHHSLRARKAEDPRNPLETNDPQEKESEAPTGNP
jgi:hypothetical protein